MELKIGQIWRENDKRFDREVEIIGFVPDVKKSVKIKTIKNICLNANYPERLGKVTFADAKRFNGKYSGYSFIR